MLRKRHETTTARPGATPPAGAAATIQTPAGDAYPARVEAVDTVQITITRPTGIPAAITFEPGTALDLVWTAPDGVHALPVVLTATAVDRVRTWQLEPAGDQRTIQRRQYVRIPAHGPVTVRRPGRDDQPDDTFTGTLVDVSEAAIQRILTDNETDPPPTVGDTVTVAFHLADYAVDTDGSVITMRTTDTDTRTRVVITLSAPTDVTDRLRRAIFTTQLANRANEPA